MIPFLKGSDRFPVLGLPGGLARHRGGGRTEQLQTVRESSLCRVALTLSSFCLAKINSFQCKAQFLPLSHSLGDFGHFGIRKRGSTCLTCRLIGDHCHADQQMASLMTFAPETLLEPHVVACWTQCGPLTYASQSKPE